MATRTKKKATKKSTRKPKKSSGSDSYGEIENDLRKKSQERRQKMGGQFWDVPQGTCYIRPVPFKNQDGDWELFVEDTYHWVATEKKMYQCAGDDCPLCKEGHDPRTRFLCNALVKDEDSMDAEIVCARLAKSLVIGNSMTGKPGMQDYIFGNIERNVKKVDDILHPKKGRWFKVKRTGKSLRTAYEIAPLSRAQEVELPAQPIDLCEIIENAPRALSAKRGR